MDYFVCNGDGHGDGKGYGTIANRRNCNEPQLKQAVMGTCLKFKIHKGTGAGLGTYM